MAGLVLAAGLIAGTGFTSDGRVRIGGVNFMNSTELGKHTLPIRGGVLCRHNMFRVYTAVLYTEPDARTAREILKPVPKSLILHYHRSIDRKDIIEASEQTLRSHPGLNMRDLRDRINTLYSWFVSVREGDEYRLDYTPETGTELIFNGRSQGVIEGDDFAEAYFGIWISDHSISRKYRDRLLRPIK